MPSDKYPSSLYQHLGKLPSVSDVIMKLSALCGQKCMFFLASGDKIILLPPWLGCKLDWGCVSAHNQFGGGSPGQSTTNAASWPLLPALRAKALDRKGSFTCVPILSLAWAHLIIHYCLVFQQQSFLVWWWWWWWWKSHYLGLGRNLFRTVSMPICILVGLPWSIIFFLIYIHFL